MTATTFLRPSASTRDLDLPPPYSLVTTREVGNALQHARSIADRDGAATLVWVRRFDLAEFALVLEPEEPLANARRAFCLGMEALARALSSQAPPEMAISFDWPDGIRVDGVLVGGARLAWPDGAAEDAVPDWLIFSSMIRLSVMRGGDAGFRPLAGGLEELGFEAPDAGTLIEGFARYMMSGWHDWQIRGFDTVAERYLARLPDEHRMGASLSEKGDLILADHADEARRKDLCAALAEPTWLDPATGAPWL